MVNDVLSIPPCRKDAAEYHAKLTKDKAGKIAAALNYGNTACVFASTEKQQKRPEECDSDDDDSMGTMTIEDSDDD
jgi:hypothetical protein